MSAWLVKALVARAQPAPDNPEACAISANSANSPADVMPEGGFGTNGTIGTASGVPADEIRARFGWIAHRLVEEHGRDAERAGRDAWAILKAELLNDMRLVPVQADTHCCFVCDGIDTPAQVLVPVLTARPDAPLWLHLDPCHSEHRRQRSREIDRLLHAALGLAGIRAGRAEESRPRGGSQNSGG